MASVLDPRAAQWATGTTGCLQAIGGNADAPAGGSALSLVEKGLD